MTLHLTDIEMAAMAEGSASTRTVEQMQAHLAECDECRGLLVDVTRLASLMPVLPSRTPTVAWGVVGLAAAGLLTIGLLTALTSRSVQTPQIASERTPAGERESVRTLLPEGVVSELHRLRFVWAADGDVSYRLTVTDATGGPVWATTTTDTTVVLPDSVLLAPGSRYYWYVDALHLDGSSATSGRREFATGSP